MQFYDRLMQETEAERKAFVATPLIQQAMHEGVPASTYLAFLGEAYHHVRHTCPLLATAVARCGERDGAYRTALLEYISEERGHEDWILDDIRALGGDAEAVRRGHGDIPCRLMVAYVYYAIEHISAYAMLGMVHVLEGMSAALAPAVVAKLQIGLGRTDRDGGFSYLRSHGALDQEHVAFFRGVVNRVGDPQAERAIIDTARMVYRLYGDMFRGMDQRTPGMSHAAA